MNTLNRPQASSVPGWLLVVALLALPNCKFEPHAAEPPDGNPLPHTTLVYCDIQQPMERHCATAVDKAMGVRLSAAAVALVGGQSGGNLGLDDSPAALARCGGEPEAVPFRGPFPVGNPLCLNGFAMGPPFNDPNLTDPPFADPNAACRRQCTDLLFGHVGPDGMWVPDPPDAATIAFCADHSRASTNVTFDPNPGFAGGCETGGVATNGYPDPRLVAERVVWVDLLPPTSLVATSNDLKRTAQTTPPLNNPPFDTGAASDQWIAGGDGYVEFSTSDPPLAALTHVLGLSTVVKPALGCLFNACADTDPSLNDIGHGISLNFDGRYYVVESGALVAGPGVNGSFGVFTAGQRFRVSAKDRFDGTATITYSVITAPCLPGSPCTETVFYTSSIPGGYPLRADASFRDQGAILTDVRIVRVHN